MCLTGLSEPLGDQLWWAGGRSLLALAAYIRVQILRVCVCLIYASSEQ